MRLGRRGFIGAITAAITATVAGPLSFLAPEPFTSLGLQSIIAETPGDGTIGGINRATFTFWRNQPQPSPHDPVEWALRMDAMSKGMMR